MDRELAEFPVVTAMGFDDPSGEFTMLYSDGRSVCRVYEMTLHGRTWTIRGQAGPDFSSVSRARWRRRQDDRRALDTASTDGSTWERDFDMRYARLD